MENRSKHSPTTPLFKKKPVGDSKKPEKIKIDERLLRINSNPIILFGKLKMDDNVSMLVKGNVIKIEDKTNDNGTVDRTYIIKGTIGEVLNNDERKIIGQEDETLDLELD